MLELKEKHCVPCEKGTVPFTTNQINRFIPFLEEGWQVIDNSKLQKSFTFENFKRGMAFVQDIAIIAENENHHPDICINYTGVQIELSTHAIGGLSENDFIVAAKIDEL